ncbi:MAG: hypothetical protein WC201_00315 [Bacilli bacterium]
MNRKGKSVDGLILPVTYKGLFKFIYKTNFMLLVKMSLILSIFAFLSFLAMGFKGIFESSILYNATGLSDEIIRERLMMFRGLYGIVYYICLLIFSIGLAGAFYVMKKLLFNEGVSFKRDFLKGIKNNGGIFLAATAFYGFIITISYFVMNLLSSDDLIQYYLPVFIVFCILSVLVLGMYLVSLMMVTIYKVSFGKMIKNALLIVITRIPYILLSITGSVLLFIICYLIPTNIALYISIFAYAFIGLGHSVLFVSIIDIYLFDELVNKKQYPEIYRKGLFDATNEDITDEGFKK